MPKISVIIPTYNTEKYISQCLESVAAQSFRDFEIILIDDCSTDNSFKIAESMKNKFKNFQLLKMKKNNGSPAYPRNKGLKIAKGDYIFFLDSDDLLIDTALEEVFEIAEKTQADVLHANQFIIATDGSEEFLKDTPVGLDSWENFPNVKKISPVTDNLADRLKMFCKKNFTWSCWNKFFRRDFLIKNKIEFANIPYSEDFSFCFKSLFLAKKYVRIPNIFYMYRNRIGSIQHRTLTAEQIIKIYLNVIIEGTKVLDGFMNSQKFFQSEENFQYRYNVLDFFINEHLEYFEEIYKKYPAHLIDVLNRENLTSIFGQNAALISYLFNCANRR